MKAKDIIDNLVKLENEIESLNKEKFHKDDLDGNYFYKIAIAVNHSVTALQVILSNAEWVSSISRSNDIIETFLEHHDVVCISKSLQ